MRTIGTLLILFALWLLMSGLYQPLLVGLGFGSSLLVLLVIRRMDARDESRLDISLSPLKFTRYMLWLMVEIARANWAVTKVILSRKMPIRQHLFAVPYSQKTDLAQVIYANSITLTPGTITVEVEGGHFLVHAVSYDEDVPAALADMDARVSKTESGGA